MTQRTSLKKFSLVNDSSFMLFSECAQDRVQILQEQFFNAALDAYVSINFLFGMDLSLSDKGSNKVNGW